MSRIRVVQVVEATTAGVKTHILSLVRELNRDRFDIAVACPSVRHHHYGDTSFVDELRALDVPVATITMRRGLHPLTDFVAIRQLCQLFLRTDVHLVHAHSTKAGLLARSAVRLIGPIAMVYSPHAFAFTGATNSLVRYLMIGIEKLFARWTDILVCVSEGERQSALNARVAPAAKLVVIRNGIDPAAFQKVSRADARVRLGIEQGVPVVGYVGRLERQKGLIYFLNTVAELSNDWPNLQCLIIGDGSLRSSLTQQVQLMGIEDQVHFLGYQPEVSAVLPALDVFVLPSLYEGLPYTLLEALASGVPIVASHVAGIQDVVCNGKTGLLVPPRDILGLRIAISQLLRNRELGVKLAQAGVELVMRDFRLEDCVRRTERLYLDVLETRRSDISPYLWEKIL